VLLVLVLLLVLLLLVLLLSSPHGKAGSAGKQEAFPGVRRKSVVSGFSDAFSVFG
jgi:hypothetical protein